MSKTKFEYNETGILERRFPHSEWLEDVEYIPITRLHLSCGGGMGGASWYEYVLQTDEARNLPANEIITVRRYDPKYKYQCKSIQINTRFVVDAEDFKIAVAKLDITNWKALQKNADVMDTIQTYYTLIDEDETLTLK